MVFRVPLWMLYATLLKWTVICNYANSPFLFYSNIKSLISIFFRIVIIWSNQKWSDFQVKLIFRSINFFKYAQSIFFLKFSLNSISRFFQFASNFLLNFFPLFYLRAIVCRVYFPLFYTQTDNIKEKSESKKSKNINSIFALKKNHKTITNYPEWNSNVKLV